MVRYLRYLRIAFSVTCGIACVLLIALWVRSYSSEDVIHISHPEMLNLRINSLPSRIYITLKGGSIRRYWETHHFDDGKAALTLTARVSAKYENKLGFGIRQQARRTVVHMPHWFMVVIAIAFAASPWLHRLRWRFNLRTLLIATTLVAVVLGAIVYAAR